MDLFTKWSQRVREHAFPAARPGESIDDLVKGLLRYYEGLWWSLDQSAPTIRAVYTNAQQKENEKKLARMVEGLIYELKRLPQSAEERREWQERLRPGLFDFGRLALNLEQRHLEFIESCGMAEASQEFARMARRFDPQISADDIFQAGRNVMTANFMQVLLGLPVEVTPSVFAYSMLYPYTDNYLDDPSVSPTTKLAFNHRFNRRLRGEEIRPANAHEARISQLVGMIETQWDRSRYPQVYESLLSIHAAQARSLRLVSPGASPYELDVLGVSFEKGGASVLADGYLVAGWLSAEQAAFMFGYGAYTQLMDDLEDISQDLGEGRMTLFSQTAGRWPLDGVTDRMFHLGQAVFGDLSAFSSDAVGPMGEIIARGIEPVLIDIIGRAGRYYSRAYMRELERHIPFRFDTIRRQRVKLARRKIDMSRLIVAMLDEQ